MRQNDNRSTDEMNQVLVSAAQVAAMLSISKREVERMASEGRMPKPVRLGPRLVRWRLETINRWLAGLEQETDSDGS